VFWYRFVQPELSRIAADFGDVVCEEVFAEQLSSHVSRAFEECAKQYMWRAMKLKKLPISFRKIGRWWGNNQKERREEEVDILAFARDKAIFGECKWRIAQAGEDVLDDLTRKAALFPAFTEVHYIIFSRSGFTESLINRSIDQGNTTLIGVKDIFFI